MQAGHYRTTAAQPALRFHEDNCHVQCFQCNHPKSGNISEYRVNLITRIGEERVEYLERDHGTPNWSIDDIIEIRDEYREKVKLILASQAQTRH
jgi:hypothetical protein